MADGCPFRRRALTAASLTLPLGAWIRVSRDDGLSVIVRVTDRGPYIRGRILDLSQAAAGRIDMLTIGVAHVTIELLSIEPILRCLSGGPTLPSRFSGRQ